MPTALSLLLMLAITAGPIDNLSAYDREAQAAAVAAIAASCDGCEDELLALWDATDRFDVRAHIVQTFVAMGERGTAGLVALAQWPAAYGDDGGAHSLIINGFVALGDGSISALMDAIEDSPVRSDRYILWRTLGRLGVDPAPYARRLLRSRHPSVRSWAIGQMSPVLPAPERAAAIISAANDPDSAVRTSAISYPFSFRWSDDDRVRHPEAFDAFIAGLRALLGSTDDNVIRGAIRGLQWNDALSDEDAELLPALFRDDTRWFWTRSDALRAYLLHLGMNDTARDEARAMLYAAPDITCSALGGVDPGLIPDDMIDVIVAAMPRCATPENNFAVDLMTPTWSGDTRPRLERRAIPSLLRALGGTDNTLSSMASTALARLGAIAEAAVPSLIDQLDTRGDGPRGHAYVTALLAIAPDDPSVRAALERVVRRGERDPAYSYVAGNTLRDLMRLRPDEPWVQELATPALSSLTHPLHNYAAWLIPSETTAVVVQEVDKLISDLLDTRARDQSWAFATGAGPEPGDPSALGDEMSGRRAATMRLRHVREPSPEVIEALIATLRSDMFESPEPPGWSEATRHDQRATHKAVVWKLENSLVIEAASTMATLLARRPQHFAQVIGALRDHPSALAHVLAGRAWDDDRGDYGLLTVPSNLPRPLIAHALDALLGLAETATPYMVTQSRIIDALSRLPTDDPRRVDMLVRLTLHGVGKDAPTAAMASLGNIRPFPRDLLEFIRLHFDDPRPIVRSSAFRAAGNAGEHALPLLEEVIERGREQLQYSTGYDALQTAQRIAPEDPRVVAFLAEYKAVQEQRRRTMSAQTP